MGLRYPIERTLLLGMVGGHFDLQASTALPDQEGRIKVPVAAGIAVIYPAESIRQLLSEDGDLASRDSENAATPDALRGEDQVETAVRVVGVDGYRAGWVAVEIDEEGEASVKTAPQLADLRETEATVVAVDIPIGIPEGAARPADAEARRFVGARGSSVFTTPPRAALLAETFAEADLVARELTGKGLSQQSFALRHRILEVDALAEADERIVEVHPEVSFCELAGRPLAYSKHKPEGLAERRELLEAEGIALPDRPPGVPEADLLDAAAAAWTAGRFARGEARPLPAGHEARIGAIWA